VKPQNKSAKRSIGRRLLINILSPISTGDLHPRLSALINTAKSQKPLRTAVVFPGNEMSLYAALEATQAGLINPRLYGDAKQIAQLQRTSSKHDLADAIFDVCDTGNDPKVAAAEAVRACAQGEHAALMKGSLHTDELMSAVVARESGLRGTRRITHIFVFDVPRYHKLLAVTDAVVNIAPDLRTKEDAILSATDLLRVLGIASPKVAIIAAVETANSAIPATLDAVALTEMANNGRFGDALVEGPFGFDNAISANAAAIKGIASKVAGDPDILLVPDLNSGNILYKSLIYMGGAECAGLVLGAKVPIILTSRADSSFGRLASCAIAVLFGAATT
jgi:phosphate acetyltransferase